MPDQWNPSATATLGNEFFPKNAEALTLDANTKVAAMSLPQTTAQNIGTLKVPVGAIPIRGGLYFIEGFDNEDAVPVDAPTTLVAVPNEDVSGGGAAPNWRTQAGGTTNLYQTIDESPVSTADFIQVGQGAIGTYRYTSRMNTGSLSLIGKRILAVDLVLDASLGVIGGVSSGTFGLNVGGVDFAASTPITSPEAVFTHRWRYNPSTKKPWTIADVGLFDTTDEWWVSVTTTDAVFGAAVVYQAYMNVIVCTENRNAVTTLDDTGSALSANALNTTTTVTTATGATPWAKDGAGKHVYLIRRANEVGSLVIPTLDSESAPPSGARGFSPTLDSTYGQATAMGSPTTRIFGLIQRTTVPADSIDSQPYCRHLTRVIGTAGAVMTQEFSNQAAVAYGFVRALIRKTSAETADLTVKVRNRSGGAQVGGTLTLTAAQYTADLGVAPWGVDSDGNEVKQLAKNLAATATLATPAQYYLEFSTAGTGWYVSLLESLDTTSGGLATFGGTTDRGTIAGVEADAVDLVATLATSPAAPAAFVVTQLDQALVTPAADDNCNVEAEEYLHGAWTPTSLAGFFTRYEVQRSDDGGATYYDIRWITTEANATFDDIESIFGVDTYYRVRVVRSDGAVSDYSAVAHDTADAKCHELAFSTNVDISRALAYAWGPQNDYDFPRAARIVKHDIYQADGIAAFFPTEEKGSSFAPTLKVSRQDTPGGVATFDELYALVNDTSLPYVCVRDHYGGRWFALVEFPTGSRDGGVPAYDAKVTITSLVFVPTILVST